MKVAVCIPTWNRANLLAFAIDSLLRQTEAAFDIHIFDDASPDNTQELIEKQYAGKVYYHRNPTNLGYVGNVNRCLSLAKDYDWIGILQDDDCHLGESVATVIKYAQKYPNAGIIFSKYNWMDAQGNIKSTSEGEEKCWQAGLEAIEATLSQWISCSATFYSSKAILNCGLYSSEFPYTADEEYATRIARSYDIVETQEILACYRQHPGHTMIRFLCKPDVYKNLERIRIRMLGYAGVKEEEAVNIVRRDLAESAMWFTKVLVAEGHWIPALRLHSYALSYRPELYLNWKIIAHLVLRYLVWFDRGA